jgi:hypothetical protein
MLMNPDQYAERARRFSMAGNPYAARYCVSLHYRAKAFWMMLNGKWVRRGNPA